MWDKYVQCEKSVNKAKREKQNLVIKGIHAPLVLANSMNKLCHGREQDSAGWEGVPTYDSLVEEAVFIIVGRVGDLFVCQRVDEFRLPSIWY